MDEDIYWKYRKTKEGYWTRKVNPKCTDCRRYEWYEWRGKGRPSIDHKCSKAEKSEELEKRCIELEESLISLQSGKCTDISLLDYLDVTSSDVKEVVENKRKNIEDELKELLKEKAKVDDEIQKCLNRKTYMAIKTDAYCFYNQIEWGISDCNTCTYYFRPVNACTLGREFRVTRGLCPVYKFGTPIDVEYPIEEEVTT